MATNKIIKTIPVMYGVQQISIPKDADIVGISSTPSGPRLLVLSSDSTTITTDDLTINVIPKQQAIDVDAWEYKYGDGNNVVGAFLFTKK